MPNLHELSRAVRTPGFPLRESCRWKLSECQLGLNYYLKAIRAADKRNYRLGVWLFPNLVSLGPRDQHLESHTQVYIQQRPVNSAPTALAGVALSIPGTT